uniref:SET domain-containing protein n=1 Tax=Brassica campestris TaxID=3711 RepID=M4FGG9_BRACM
MAVHLISPIARTLALIFISLPSLINTSQLDYDTLVFSQCDSSDTNILQKVPTKDPSYSNPNLLLRAQALYSFLSKLESESSRAKFFKTLVGNEQHAVSGWFQCREDYPSEICHRCVRELRDISSRLCGNATSARVHLRGCHMVYEIEHVDTPTSQANHHNYKLLETPERGLIHKICDGATAETLVGFEEMRTVALTAAETGVVDGHGFYEESYKLLHVVAQCDGHVEACDCGECVSAAAAAAAEECPWSTASQIYLEGCYVGYTYNPHEYPGDSYHEEGGKTSTGKSLAIVVGGVAALVFVAIFFLFLKSLRRKGDVWSVEELDMQPLILTDERVRKACETTRELKIPDEKTLSVLKKLLQENGENWTLIKLDNYTALIDAIYSLDDEQEEEEEDKKKNETLSNANRGKHVFDSAPSGALKKQGKNVVVGTDSPATLKRKYETRSAASGSSTEEAQKHPSNGVVRKKKYKTIIRDITKGSESVEISLVDEVGTEHVPKFTYIPHNIVYQSAYVHVSLARISDDDCCVSCKGDCLLADFPCACARETGGEYAYSKDGLLKEEFLDTCLKMKKAPDSFSKFYCQDCPLERDDGKCEGHLIRKFIKECWRKCGCDMMCGNRVVQRGIRCQLQVYFTQEGKGWGIRTLQDLPKGTFVCEYIGEILTNTELYDRNIRSTSERHTYPVTLDADWGSEKDLKDEEALCLDATVCGNVARFVNHRCEDANLIDIPVQIETPDRHYYHIAFFTIRDVKAMDELTWDYLIDFHDESHPVKAFRCCCGSELCRDKKPKGSGGKSGERRKAVPAKKQAGRGGTSGNKFRMSLGLPVAATVNCADNTGAKNLYIISVKGIKGRLNRLPSACVGDMVMATVKKGKPDLRKKVLPAVIVRQRKPWRRKDGVFMYFEDNAGVIVNPKGEMKGSAITGPIGKECADLWPRIASAANAIV